MDALTAPVAPRLSPDTGRLRVRVRGLVQGVGFRPHVYGLARRHGLAGWVLNDAEGVLLEVEGEGRAAFLVDLVEQAPPLSRIDAVEIEPVLETGGTGFDIRQSGGGATLRTAIGPDSTVCPDCLAEMFDPAARRYRYPFTTCTHCGPRFTIARGLPYDRPLTSMAGFPLCPDCAAEYADPGDRRFHAQPLACPACGPRLSMPVEEILARLRRGEIVAIKGLGGFHLACDARNREAVARLRQRKQRDGKPFAVMVANLESARALADLTEADAAALESRERPIVLCRVRSSDTGNATFEFETRHPSESPQTLDSGTSVLNISFEEGRTAPFRALSQGERDRVRGGRPGQQDPVHRFPLPEEAQPLSLSLPLWGRGRGDGVRPQLRPDLNLGAMGKGRDDGEWKGEVLPLDLIAPHLADIGLMLPYAPLHFLLFHEAAGRPDGTAWLAQPQPLALVMTSANPGGEPLVVGNGEAAARLEGIADAIVTHDRDIVARADDSVVRVVAGRARLLRRGRGFVPVPIRLPRVMPPVLALGAYLKNAICVTRGREAFLSQHVGDLDDAATLDFLAETVRHLTGILDVAPVAVAHDLHPDFPSTRLAEELGLPTIPVQHHHAHLAAVLAEHGVEGPTVGLALDGHGLGDDGGAWGGELLRLEGAGFTRLGHLRRLAQPGGDVAARQPWRMAASALHALGRGGEIAGRFVAHGPSAALAWMLDKGVRSPPTSSCGRWFDAACGLLGLVAEAGFEGEAPMRLEALVTRPRVGAGLWSVDGGVLDLLPLLSALDGMGPADGADLFHGTLAAALVDWALPAVQAAGGERVALSGGCVMNKVLAEALVEGFGRHGVTALLPRLAPANDGGLALGQAWVAARVLDGQPSQGES